MIVLVVPKARALPNDSIPPLIFVVPEYVLAFVSQSVPEPDFVKARLFSLALLPPSTPANVTFVPMPMLTVSVEVAALPPTMLPPEPDVLIKPNV